MSYRRHHLLGTFAALFLAVALAHVAAAADEATPAAAAPLAEFVREISLGSDPSQAASGVAVGADGTLYVIDSLQDQLRVFDDEGNPIATWGETGDGPGQFAFHQNGAYWGDLAIGPDGNLYVLDVFNHRIQVLSPDGAALREWGEAGKGDGQFGYSDLSPIAGPGGITVDGAGRVYVADSLNGRVQIFDSSGEFLGAWDVTAPDVQGGMFPTDVAVDAAGMAWVTDYITNRVFRLDRDGNVVAAFGGTGGSRDDIVNPWGAAVDAQGNVYIAKYSRGEVLVLATDGSAIGSIGSLGLEPGQFASPIFVTIGPDGFLYVAEEGNRRVQVLRLLLPSVTAGTPATA